MKDKIIKSFEESSEVISQSKSLSDVIVNAINEIIKSINTDHKVVVFGNGGSAADSQHIAAELIGRFQFERHSIPAISLTTDTSVITSISNDYSYEMVFSRQCESLVQNGDTVIGISTSGNSKNIINGLTTSKEKGAAIIGLLGNDGGKIKEIVDIAIIVDSSSTPRIQEVHRLIYHIICEHVEEHFCKK